MKVLNHDSKYNGSALKCLENRLTWLNIIPLLQFSEMTSNQYLMNFSRWACNFLNKVALKEFYPGQIGSFESDKNRPILNEKTRFVSVRMEVICRILRLLVVRYIMGIKVKWKTGTRQFERSPTSPIPCDTLYLHF